MLFVVDIGNSNITLGIYSDDNLLFTARLATQNKLTADQYAVDLYNILKIQGVDPKKIEGSIISSVVPNLTTVFKKAIKIISNQTPMIVGPGVKSGLNIKIDNPAQLGPDLVVGAVAAIAKFPLPCIVVDLGTATTISVINQKGEFLGGCICTGIGISLEALTQKTSQLPAIDIETPQNVIGSNTVDCMKSGLTYGTAAMLDGLTQQIENELGSKCTLVATGGLSNEIIKNCKRSYTICDNLLLEGLRLIYYKNNN